MNQRLRPPTGQPIRILPTLVPALALLLYGGVAAAQPQARQEEHSWSLGLALGRGQRDNPLINGESIDINAVIDFSWYGEHLFFDNGDFGYVLAEDHDWGLNVVATFNNERHFYNYLSGRSFGLESVLDSRFGFNSTPGEPPGKFTDGTTANGGPAPTGLESPEFVNLNTELPDRDFALNGGLELLFISRFGDIQAQLLNDLSSTHNGQEAWLSWSRPWYTRNSEFTLTLGAEWKSRNLVGYYYGVLPTEAFNGRTPYAGAAGTNTFIRLAGRHRLGRNWNLVGMVEREFLSSAISASPIVDQDTVDTFFAGLYYQF